MAHSLADFQAAIYGIAGTKLTNDDISFIKSYRPWGFILFARNIENRAQVLELTNQLRDVTGRDSLPILIDQEGGRVARLRPPHARLHPPAEVYGTIHSQNPEKAIEAARLGGYLIGQELRALGITVNCMPCLDVARGETSDVIGDRAYSDNPAVVSALGRSAAEGLMRAGVLPVIKHIPGHGRGAVDSHLSLPTVSASEDEMRKTDFLPFIACQDLPLGMTGHLKFTALDADNVSTQSDYIIQQLIRQHIGFDGLLMGDDISMKALSDTLPERALKTLQAGCDLVLHCNGDFVEMQALADILPCLQGKSLERAEKVQETLAETQPIEIADASELWGELLAGHFPKGAGGV